MNTSTGETMSTLARQLCIMIICQIVANSEYVASCVALIGWAAIVFFAMMGVVGMAEQHVSFVASR